MDISIFRGKMSLESVQITVKIVLDPVIIVSAVEMTSIYYLGNVPLVISDVIPAKDPDPLNVSNANQYTEILITTANVSMDSLKIPKPKNVIEVLLL